MSDVCQLQLPVLRQLKCFCVLKMFFSFDQKCAESPDIPDLWLCVRTGDLNNGMIKVKGHWTLNIDNAHFITGGISSVIEIIPVISTLNQGPWGKVCHVFSFLFLFLHPGYLAFICVQ